MFQWHHAEWHALTTIDAFTDNQPLTKRCVQLRLTAEQLIIKMSFAKSMNRQL